MNYEKPKITLTLNAVESIQGTKTDGMWDNTDPTSSVYSTPAYQADE